MNKTIDGANVFLKSSRYKPLTTTDTFGSFRVNSVCLMDEEVYIEADGFSSILLTPIAVNDTHWTLSKFQLETYGNVYILYFILVIKFMSVHVRAQLLFE